MEKINFPLLVLVSIFPVLFFLPIASATLIYQETANAPHASDGNYTLNYTGSYNLENKNYLGYLYINYTKPANAVGASWQVKHGLLSTYYVNIPSNCFTTNTIQLRFISEFIVRQGTGYGSYGQCFNGTSWNTITNISEITTDATTLLISANPSSIYDGDWNTGALHAMGEGNWLDAASQDANPYAARHARIYEEAIVWNISEPIIPSLYSITDINISGNKEHRFYYNNFHFMSVIETAGAISIRPHPGTDVNGWGSSLYLQPFFPGAVLKNTKVNFLSYDNNYIYLNISGNVSKGTAEKYGNWNSSLKFSYNQTAKKIQGNGAYAISLSGAMSSSTGDLNLYKLASNYLSDVPLLSGGIGDTGDMKNATVIAGINFTWNPKLQPAHFPWPPADYLSIDVQGNYNNVNTSAQGYEPIAPAYKPSMKVILQSKISGISMIFGGIYDTTKSKQFWADNVGITPLILNSDTGRNFNFDIQFESEAPAEEPLFLSQPKLTAPAYSTHQQEVKSTSKKKISKKSLPKILPQTSIKEKPLQPEIIILNGKRAISLIMLLG